MRASWIRPHRRPILDDVNLDQSGAEYRDSPITNSTDEDLTNNDTANLEVLDGINPGFIASLKGLPAGLPDSLEKWSQVTDGEEDITLDIVSHVVAENAISNSPFETQTSSRKNSIFEVPSNWAQRILLNHCSDLTQLLLGFITVNFVVEGNLLPEG